MSKRTNSNGQKTMLNKNDLMYGKNDTDLTIRQVISKYNVLHKKSFGQHFLCDYSLLKKIALCASPFGEDFDVVEIGAGPCGLTRAIIDVIPQNFCVFSVEIDKNFSELHDQLNNCYTNGKLYFVYEDALKIKLSSLTNKKVIIISNLPYNVGTAILINWIHNELQNIEKMILLFQKEVARRITAKTGTKEYGRLSVISQLTCNCEKLFDISEAAFYPPPKVTSTLVKLTPVAGNSNIDTLKLERTTNICFQQRRKTIFSILKSKIRPDILKSILESCSIRKSDRPETITPEQFLLMSRAIPDIL